VLNGGPAGNRTPVQKSSRDRHYVRVLRRTTWASCRPNVPRGLHCLSRSCLRGPFMTYPAVVPGFVAGVHSRGDYAAACCGIICSTSWLAVKKALIFNPVTRCPGYAPCHHPIPVESFQAHVKSGPGFNGSPVPSANDGSLPPNLLIDYSRI
jgi:hypothetical protein